jgi:hypothetical protein
MICPFCQKEHPDGTKFCPVTGQALNVSNPCPFCGQLHPPNIQYCPITGKSIYPSQKVSKGGIPFRLWLGLVVFVLTVAIAAGIWVIGNNGMSNSTPAANANFTLTPLEGSILPSVTHTVLSQTPDNKSALTAAAQTLQSETPQITPPTLTPTITNEPFGKIVYTCQIFKNNDRNQICIINADGTNQRRLTSNDLANHFYPSISPDGSSIVFSSNQTGTHEISEMDLEGNQRRLTSLGNLYAPEISPDGSSIVFTNTNGTYSSIWVMDRNGNNPRKIYQGNVDALDPTWSPDGDRILFAMGSGDNKKLYTVNKSGGGLNIVNENFSTRGRSDWSWMGDMIAGYSGGSWKRKVYLMNSNGSNLIELYSSGNVQAPSFSPNDKWVAFTGYIDKMGNENGCEIYILKIIGEDLTRLTNNDYCDWQPRWGP